MEKNLKLAIVETQGGDYYETERAVNRYVRKNVDAAYGEELSTKG